MTVEAFLARLYADVSFRDEFLAAPRRVALQAGLSEGECDALENIDREGLELAAESYARKRSAKQRHVNRGGRIAGVIRFLRGAGRGGLSG